MEINWNRGQEEYSPRKIPPVRIRINQHHLHQQGQLVCQRELQ
ncbi:hypothetical protein CLV59_103434 [Chitinophaga dinghuensis]|uniref:Uncharacterized protein n=1 Tax=Chitinophaga dinghuensis TaxID=1539050 RepID=A0A327W515_9BACT|nr:hypothetical protein CLV59_103434 [Chitinophaga dinghuensis]